MSSVQNTSDASITAENIGVWYKNSGRQDTRSIILEAFRRERKESSKTWAVQGVSFSANPAEVIGIIGANGAGKSTLCNVIAKVLRPDAGSIQVKGEISALLSMGTGFNSELSGRENILINGLMLGFKKKQVLERMEEIIEFSGVRKFIDEPIKHYSSGMKGRLGFSIAATLNPEILVIDEALGAGDAQFGKKASARMKELVQGAHLVVVVSHTIPFIAATCDTVLWVDKGEVKAMGKAEEVTTLYEESVPKKKSKRILTREYIAPETTVTSTDVVQVENISVNFRVGGKPFSALDNVSFRVKQGEILGIIGRNGAGKTTLCRVLTNIYRPDGGKVYASQKVSAMLSIGTGFNGQLPARDNILLNGMMLGMSKKHMQSIADEIISFAELEKHRDKQLKHYSSGMKSRLAFSIAVAVDPALLIVDEALNAGDLSFKQKAQEAMDAMIRKAEAVIVVSHNLAFIENVCTRALWLEGGKLQFDGPSEEAVRIYTEYTAKK